MRSLLAKSPWWLALTLCMCSLLSFADESATTSPSSYAETEARIEQEEENLRLSREAERRLQERMRELLAEDTPDAELVREYAEYLEKLEAIRMEHERALGEMLAVYTNRSAATETEIDSADQDDSDLEFNLPSEDEQSTRLDDLNKAFEDSVEDFDRFLHKEQEGVEAKVRDISENSSKRVSTLKSEAGDKRDALLKRGENLPGSKSEKPPAGKKPPKEPAKDKPKPAAKEGGSPAENAPIKGPAQNNEPVPDRNPQTDDVVARQLREAAEKETDPELKRRLWAEYDAYKAGIE